MGHGDEPMPAEVIDDLRDQLGQAESRLRFYEHTTPAVPPLIYGAMIEAMREVVAVGKDGRNTQQNYQFRGIDGVLNAVGPALRKAGIFVTSKIIQADYRDTLTTGDKKTREFTARIAYTFWAADGSSVTTEVPGESLDQSDKGAAKGMSVAFRIALIQALALPTDEPTTDHDGQYKTRAGSTTLSGWTSSYGRKLAHNGEAPEVIEFWAAVVESSSVEAPMGPETTKTWGEGIADRIAHLVAEENSPEELRELYGWLKAADMLGLWHVDAAGLRFMLGDLVVERGKTALGNRVKAFDHCMTLITSANSQEELDNARVHVRADAAPEGVLTPVQLAELLAVATERYNKLINLEAATTLEFLPPVGAAWDQFVQFADRQNLIGSDIEDMINGQWDKNAEAPAAYEYGLNGLIRLADAVKRSNARDHTIGDFERENLLQLIRDRGHENGIEITDSALL